MEFHYSPHREGGGAMHLPSPSHRHGYGMEIPSSIQQLRRSLSRSPSKPSRFHLRRPDSSGSPLSPLALNRAFSPKSIKIDQTPIATDPESPFAPNKKRFVLRRPTSFRSSPRNRAKSKSPRRILAESTHNGNTTPFTTTTMRQPGEENTTTRRTSAEPDDTPETEQRPSMRFDIDDKPIKFGISRSRMDLSAPGAPAKSSPLKRSDGIMNLDAASVGSPVAKRRSLLGVQPPDSESDFDLFDHATTTTPATPNEEPKHLQHMENGNTFSFSSPITNTYSPLRKSTSLRKSTLSQRHGASLSRSTGDFAFPGQAASKSRPRITLDNAGSHSFSNLQTPVRRLNNFEPVRQPSQQPVFRGAAASHQPHPLSNTVNQSSSTFSMATGLIDAPPLPTFQTRNSGFSRSLPIGACRPNELESGQESSGGLFETPMGFRLAKPHPAPFMSTGLVSKKKNRDVDDDSLKTYMMPGTPSKRASFPPLIVSPSTTRRNVFDTKISRPEFGQPSTPFSYHKGSSSASFGKGVNIFGSLNTKPGRRSSFASIDGDRDENLENPPSPCGNLMMDSQSSNEDMPPTPTKQNDGSGRRKDSSLRRQTFRQQRVSLGSDTFTAPTGLETPGDGILSFGASSPRTPNEAFTPPDPSSLSISGKRRGSLQFNSSTNSQFPPATPTAIREHVNFFNDNDVDATLFERFDRVTLVGGGEFSKVYRAEKSIERSPGFGASPTHVWAVKKMNKPYLGVLDREQKLREVHILQALRGHDHIVSYEDHWEHDALLYIQTEFCEEGNLYRFLHEVGFKGRLDDFRIWKILLEFSSGVQYIHQSGFIHLDLKPHNVLITFDGALKIADFGLASTWPAPRFIDGEGDRRYLAPEALQGRYDKPCDVFALGTIMCEIAANIVVPDGGTSWQRLRSGDLSELGSLTWSSDSSLDRDENGEPIVDPDSADNSPLKSIDRSPPVQRYLHGLAFPPSFMTEIENPDSLQKVIEWMMNPTPELRPTIDQVLHCYGCQWVGQRSRAAATIYEGNWGPENDVLDHNDQEADMMDTS